MLDDLKYIHEKDSQDALGLASKQWEQLKYDFELQPAPVTKIDNIVFAGMGGSALAAAISTSWPGYDKPFEICRSYNIPRYVGNNTLFIASSYSGNTEETLTAVYEAENKGAQIAVISAGGQLTDKAKEKNYPLVALPAGMQPRMATFYSLAGLLQLLEALGVNRGSVEKLAAEAEYVRIISSRWVPDAPVKNNLAKQIAQDIVGSSMVIYAGPLLFPAAYKWKISFNENAKNVAWCGQYPEFNHNEFIGWSSHPVNKPYKVIDLRSSLENERVQKRFEVTEKLLSGRRPSPAVIKIEGGSLLQQLLWATTLGDFVTLYVALLNGLNPTPVDLIEQFKKELG